MAYVPSCGALQSMHIPYVPDSDALTYDRELVCYTAVYILWLTLIYATMCRLLH